MGSSTMELGSVLKFLENKTLLVTGATGFLSKILVEKILRTQPNVKRLYLLVRAPDQESAIKRLQNEILEKDLFRVLKDMDEGKFKWLIEEKVKMVAGDVSVQDFDIKDVELKDEMFRDLNVIINSAATTKFYERYDNALLINTFGANHVVGFAKKCTNLHVLVHISTAYVSGERGGLILESPYRAGETLDTDQMSELDMIQEEKRVMEKKLVQLQAEGAAPDVVKVAMKDLGLERARKHGWPNVYVFTKALGEMMVIQKREHLPLVIIRPTIVTSTYKEPFPGWIEGVRTSDIYIAGFGQGRLKFFMGDPKTVLDHIPGDMVVNATLVAMVAHASQASTTSIYHVGSSLRNPMTIALFHDVFCRYFTNYPWINKEGNLVKVSRCKIIDSADILDRHIAINYWLPLKVLELVNMALFGYFASTYEAMKREINLASRLGEAYKTYAFFNGIFDDSNTEKLRSGAGAGCSSESGIFYFDPTVINWEDYYLHVHIPGLVKYELNLKANL